MKGYQKVLDVDAWIMNGYRGSIIYSTGTGKTEIAFECARRACEAIVHQERASSINSFNVLLYHEGPSTYNTILSLLPPVKRYMMNEAVKNKRLARPLVIPIKVDLT